MPYPDFADEALRKSDTSPHDRKVFMPPACAPLPEGGFACPAQPEKIRASATSATNESTANLPTKTTDSLSIPPNINRLVIVWLPCATDAFYSRAEKFYRSASNNVHFATHNASDIERGALNA